MYRVKQTGNEEANIMAEAMKKAMGMGPKKPRDKFDRGDKLPFDLPEPKLVSIQGGASDVRRHQDEEAQTTSTAQKTPTSVEERGEFQDGLVYDDDDFVLKKMRESRVQSIKSTMNVRQKYAAKGHGSLSTISQDEFLPTVTETKLVVCHFFHEEFETCQVMDKHLKKLTTKYIPVRFVRISASKAPFFVEKLNIRVLPTVVMFKDGIALDRQVGFEGLSEDDDFPTEKLERRLHTGGVLASLNEEGEIIHGITHKDEKEEELKRINAIRAAMVKETYDDFDLDTTDDDI